MYYQSSAWSQLLAVTYITSIKNKIFCIIVTDVHFNLFQGVKDDVCFEEQDYIADHICPRQLLFSPSVISVITVSLQKPDPTH